MATLIVEDGTGVANANSYVDLTYARSFADNMNLVLPVNDDDAIHALLGAMPYIESRPYAGQRSSPTQALSWPRKLVTADGYPVADNVVPEGIRRAQVTAAAMVANGTDLLPTVVGGAIIEETVGPITTKYSDGFLATYNGLTVFTAIDVYLNPFITAYGGYRLSPQFGF